MSVLTNSINWDQVSIRDLIWIETTFFLYKNKNEEFHIGIALDNRVLLKDISDCMRIKLSGNTKNCLKVEDLPSNVNKRSLKQNVEIKKAFLMDLARRTNTHK